MHQATDGIDKYRGRDDDQEKAVDEPREYLDTIEAAKFFFKFQNFSKFFKNFKFSKFKFLDNFLFLYTNFEQS